VVGDDWGTDTDRVEVVASSLEDLLLFFRGENKNEPLWHL
jgi:hypothetical protein